MKNYILILFCFFVIKAKSQSCTSTVYYDNMETFTWFGDWWTYSFSNFYNNFSVSAPSSAVHYGSGTGTSGIEQDWYVLPTITGLNPNYTYRVRFKLASFTLTSPSASTRGLDAADFLQVQLSRNGSAYVAEMSIYGFSNQTWDYNATGIANKTANGTNSIFQITTGGFRTDAYSTVELTLQPNTTSVAIDIYMRCNSAGEEFWIDNVELIEIIPRPVTQVFGTSYLCQGDSASIFATGGDTYSWSSSVQNAVNFLPSASSNYIVTVTNRGMLNGTGSFNTCSSLDSIFITVDPNCGLPIFLSSFTGENKNTTNHLYWVTEQEINSSHFEIERSKDGIDFYYIGRANANETNPYEFVDEVPLIGDNYYRLKMVDLDGSYTYSKIINIISKLENLDYILFPNPINENVLTYRSHLSFSKDLSVYLFDINGREVFNYHYETSDLINVITINLESLEKGYYTVKIIHKDGTTRTAKIIKI